MNDTNTNHNLTDIQKLLMSYEEMVKARKYKSPYTFILNGEGEGPQVLYYFGANHSSDSQNSQYEALQNFWEDFLKNTTGKTRLVLVEGGKRKLEKSLEEAIAKGSEGSFITYLAKQEGVPTDSPDTTVKEEVEKLTGEFSFNEIGYFFFARSLASWGRHKSRPSFENWAAQYMEKKKKVFPETFTLSLKEMRKTHQQLFGGTLTPTNSDFFKSITRPDLLTTKINKISRQNSHFREAAIVSNILEFWEKGLNLFVVFGVSHAYRQETALRQIVRNNRP